MKITSNGHSVSFFKRKAKNLKKQLGISHTEALNLIAKEQGYPDWDSFAKKINPTEPSKVTVRRPMIPKPTVLNYHNFITGAVIGQHPNTKMTVRRHARVGVLLQILLDSTAYHKRAKNHLEEIRRILDTWLGCEYSEEQLANAEFNQIYYGRTTGLPYQAKPSVSQQARLKRSLRDAKAILNRSYHDCKPLEKLYQRFEQAYTALENWPVKMLGAKRFKKELSIGTFVRFGKTKKTGIVFYHDTLRETVEGYSDGGRFVSGRHEVSVLRKQLDIASFKPMRLHLPYGKWICGDGRQVLFNRDYCPIWDRTADGVVKAIEPDVYVPHQESEFYYGDDTAPYYDNLETVHKCLSVLDDWGVSTIKSRVLERIPTAIANRDFAILNPKGIS